MQICLSKSSKILFFRFYLKKLCVSKKSSSSEGFSLQCSIDVQMLSSSSKVEYLWNFCQHTQVLFFIREAEIVQETSCCVAVKMSSSVRNIMLRSSKDVVQCKIHHVA